MLRRTLTSLGSACLLGYSALATADFPTKPIRFVLGTSPGGGGDVVARIVAPGMETALGHTVVIENRAGAASNMAAGIVANAPADGYTMLEISITHALNASLYPKLPFRLMRDFAPVTQMGSSPQVLVVHPSFAAKSVAELVTMAKAKPGGINYASAGTGTSTFLAAEIFKSRAGVDLLHVAYRGGGASLTAALSGESPVYFAPVAASLAHIKQGRLRALAMTSSKRLALLPDLPTIGESGYPGYDCSNWYGIMVPAKTPKEIVGVLHKATIAALGRPDINKRLNDLGYILAGDSPEQFRTYIASQIEVMAKVVKDLKLTASDM